MKRIFFIVFAFWFLAFSLFSEEIVSPEHKIWLGIVSPIITKTEREIFLKLKSDKERDKFIQFFWKQHDSRPDTADNEFFKEYMERIRFADLNFGSGSSKKGSQTERGYYYLLLGPPLERQFFAAQSELYPLELWYYQGEEQFGLPSYFYLIFYQPQGLGEYRLYYPDLEGPEKLVVPSYYDRSQNRDVAFEIIRKISGELASASLSYLPGERSMGQSPSFSSDAIISNIHALSEKKFSDAYARSYLNYQDYVETEYSHNFIESSFKVKVFKNDNQFFVHWSLEPKKINFALLEEKYCAVFDLILKIENGQGNLLLEKEEEIPLKISPEQYRCMSASPLLFKIFCLSSLGILKFSFC